MVYLVKPAKYAYLVNRGYANFQKTVWMRIICIPRLRILAMHEANTALLDVLVDNFVIIPPFQNSTKSLFAQRCIDVISAVRF